ncbi:hypothetical protein FC35_GL000107 [Limosilactobacillus coleohominis DSM 14060]|nr:hypothetical protein FC35_GL000107 [Limosilactobacillus coleohominis DSM 14060]
MEHDNKKIILEAEQLFREQKDDEVIERLAPICQEKVPWEVNLLYVKALYRKGQAVRAYQEALPYEEDYLINKFTFWEQLLLANQLFIPARIALTIKGVKQPFLTQIRDAEKIFEIQQAETLQKRFKNFYHLGDHPDWKQQEIIRDADHLPLNKYVQGAKFILRDPFVGIVIRNTILKTLAALRYSQSVTYIGVDGKDHDTVPAKIETSSYQKIINKVDQLISDCFKDNPIDQRNYLQQFHLQAFCLYPMTEEVITDPTAWVAVLTGNDDHESQTALENAIRWQKAIQKSLINLH